MPRTGAKVQGCGDARILHTSGMPRRIRCPRTCARAVAGVSLLVACAGVAGCSSPSGFGPFHFKLAGPALPRLKAPEYSLVPRPPLIGIQELLDPGFYPPGATKIAPDRSGTVSLAPAARAAYPSDERSASPVGGTILFTASRRMGNSLHHELVAATKRTQQTLYSTTKHFWTLWSPSGKQIAVTVFMGGNVSFVFVIDATTGAYAAPLAPLSSLTPPFTDNERYAPQWIIAYGWTPQGQLILRGAGASGTAAPSAFGYEVLADVSSPSAPSYTLLRAYRIAPLRPRPSGTRAASR